MRPRTRRLRTALRAALAVAAIVSTCRALGWSYRTFCPSGKRDVALARADALFHEGLDALHVRGDWHKALDAWSDEHDICRALPGTEDEQAGCSSRLGDVLLELGRDAEAIDKYEQALELYKKTRYSEIDQAQCRKKIAEIRARASAQEP